MKGDHALEAEEPVGRASGEHRREKAGKSAARRAEQGGTRVYGEGNQGTLMGLRFCPPTKVRLRRMMPERAALKS